MSQTAHGFPQPTEDGAAEGRGDPVRRVVAILLVIYLSPALLVVFLVGGLGVALCSTVQLARRLAGGASPARPMRGVPHLVAAGREIRTSGR